MTGSGRQHGGAWRRGVGAAERLAVRDALPGGGGLCVDCRHLALVRSRRSSFVRCRLAEADPAYPRYPSLPVRDCLGFEMEPAAPAEESLARLPDPRLPLWYFVFAHLALLSAFAAVAVAPATVAGFHYHPRMLAVVHLVTLGWITASILGALYMIVPMALAAPLPAGRADRWVFGGFAVGAAGMASHFWIDEPRGMAWAAVLAALAALWVAGRTASALRRAPLPAEVRLHFQLAFCNLLLAAILGVLIALDKFLPVLAGSSLDHVHAHAHLAAIGWATMMVVAAGYRLLPMILPAAAPRGPWLWVGAVLLEAGVLGLTVTLWTGRGGRLVWAATCAAGLGIALSRVRWMVRHSRPAPRGRRRTDAARIHLAAAGLWLGAAMGLGVALAATPPAAWRLPAILAYGVAGLVGFLSQMVVGVEGRLLPLYVWLRARRLRPAGRRPPPPSDLPGRRLQATVLGLWTIGVPLLAVGLTLDRHGLLRAGAVLLAAAAAAGLAQIAVLLRRAG